MDMLTAVGAFSQISTTIIGDCTDRLCGTSLLRPYHGATPLCGPARTVQVAEGDNLFLHHALDIAASGDVIVCAGNGLVSRALLGELMMLYARKRGIAGFVVDGAIRDVSAFRETGFPCFARAHTLRGPFKNGPGAVDIPVSIDGMVVRSGELIVADEDGIICIPLDEAEAVLAKCQVLIAEEERRKAAIAAGKSDRSWVKRQIAEFQELAETT